jgi:hypothetical protein
MTDELPRRPRRKLATPLTATLAAVLIAALGFIGGVQVQKSSADSSSSPRAAGFTRGGGGFTPGGAGAAGGGGGSSDATVGTVADVNGKTLYVTDSSGATIRVKTTSNSKIARTAVAKVGEVHPGDTVIVQGTKSSSGTVTATSVTATAKNATSGLAGLFRGGGTQNQTQEGNDG